MEEVGVGRLYALEQSNGIQGLPKFEWNRDPYLRGAEWTRWELLAPRWLLTRAVPWLWLAVDNGRIR